MIDGKIKWWCNRCKNWKTDSEMSNRKAYLDGKGNICLACVKDKHVEDPILVMVHNTRAHHKQTIEASNDYLYKLFSEATTCPYTGKKLVRGIGRLSPQSPSLDRIDVTKGYIEGNLRIISHEANAAKGEKSEQEFMEFIQTIYYRGNTGILKE